MRRISVLALALAATAGPAVADVVHLHGGGRIEGQVVAERPDAIVVEVSAGRLTLPRHRVAKVVLGTSALAGYRARAARLAAGDVQGWLALAAWARANDLLTQERAALEHVLEVDPANAIANRALGHVMVSGRWVTADEGHRARGFVQFEGAWVRPEERQVILEERAARAAEQRERAEAEARVREAEARARVAEAEARRLEAEERQAEDAGGIPYPFVFGGGFDPFVPTVGPFALPPEPPPIVVVKVRSRHDGHRHTTRTPPARSSSKGMAGRRGER